MGAHEFEAEAFGKDAADAFRSAREYAIWEHGHDGYNGTISTVQGYIEVEVPRGWSSDDFIDMVWWLEQEGRGERGTRVYNWSTGGFGNSPQTGSLPELKTRRKFDHDWEKRFYDHRRALLNKAKRLTPEQQRHLFVAAGNIQKWECCVAFRVPAKDEKEYREHYGFKGRKGGVWKFFGLAAS